MVNIWLMIVNIWLMIVNIWLMMVTSVCEVHHTISTGEWNIERTL